MRVDWLGHSGDGWLNSWRVILCDADYESILGVMIDLRVVSSSYQRIEIRHLISIACS